MRSTFNRFPSLKKVVLSSLLVCLPLGVALATSPPENVITEYQEANYSEAQLEQLLAPIALYPDSLLTHILIASTYPLEIVEAARWQELNDSLADSELADEVDQQPWDPSVKALIAFPLILSKLNEDLSWTQKLGHAFLQDEESVLSGIQSLRKRAEFAGNLDDSEHMKVIYEDEDIIIEPVEKEIIYVPYYDTRVVYGDWYWANYPPVYWRNYYVNRPYRRYGAFYWNSGVRLSFNFSFSSFHWHNRHVIVNYPKVYSYGDYRYNRRHSSRGHFINHINTKRWHYKPRYHNNSAYRSGRVSQGYKNKHVQPIRQKHAVSHQRKHVKNHVRVTNTQRQHHQVSQRLKRDRVVKVDKKITTHSSYKAARATQQQKVDRSRKVYQAQREKQYRPHKQAQSKARSHKVKQQTPSRASNNRVKQQRASHKPRHRQERAR